MKSKKFYLIVIPVIAVLVASLYILASALPSPLCGKNVCDSNAVLSLFLKMIFGCTMSLMQAKFCKLLINE